MVDYGRMGKSGIMGKVSSRVSLCKTSPHVHFSILNFFMIFFFRHDSTNDRGSMFCAHLWKVFTFWFGFNMNTSYVPLYVLNKKNKEK